MLRRLGVQLLAVIWLGMALSAAAMPCAPLCLPADGHSAMAHCDDGQMTHHDGHDLQCELQCLMLAQLPLPSAALWLPPSIPVSAPFARLAPQPLTPHLDALLRPPRLTA
ncbi:hypothetical protein [Isoalcanivorax beigongshangi]|uniref:DUF2946 domain-containing protein n=1 Tax=Isoalcanivorax beigongshangi TaxID=3238810 RepID=A0ABV4AK43_9GAMM